MVGSIKSIDQFMGFKVYLLSFIFKVYSLYLK